MLSSTCISRWLSNSASNCCVRRSALNSPVKRIHQARSDLMRSHRGEELRHDRSRVIPLARRFFEALAPRTCQLVEARLAIGLRHAPLPGDVALLLQLEKRRVERAVVDRQAIAARLLDAPGDAVAMHARPSCPAS